MALCYNFSRALKIIGLDRFIAYFAQKARKSSILRLLDAIAPAIGAPTQLSGRLWGEIGAESASRRRPLGCAA
jgi:hypothetical protein